MNPRVDTFDLGGLRLSSGEGRRLELAVAPGSFELGGERYEAEPAVVPVRIDVSRTNGNGYALRLRYGVALRGPCMRCLGDAAPRFEIDAREISQPGGGDELESPYVTDTSPVELAVSDWVHDALGLALPAQILCRPGCLGLCPECGANLNETGPGHVHERPLDPRWAKLSQLRLDGD